MSKKYHLLAIESSCDDTGAAVLCNDKVLSNIIAGQEIHSLYGGVVPELASRAHQQNIVPVVDIALQKANISLKDIDAIAYTQGPGLMGSLLVGGAFAKSMAMALQVPLIPVNHMQAHILAHFIDDAGSEKPEFPFLALTISGGHTQIVRVDNYDNMTVLGETTDDAVGEAFDKTAKLLGLPYPGGPLIDKYARDGEAIYPFTKPKVDGLNFSFSGLKTQIMYFVQKESKKNPDFIKENIHNIAASVQKIIIDILMDKVEKAIKETGIIQIAIGGGVSANSGIRQALLQKKEQKKWKVFIPKTTYTTDNAAMIGIVGYFKYINQSFDIHQPLSKSRLTV
ncbi:MAG TPA: tRNA (adenosine(37)-N6)-threonylcarbamoyltransferase complex transferase subunit TsaD [Flavobacterium sp.]|nr:tRNA (adenosine(37)-N6)-threonylcarbamoyltransferase complex transferase subunit TsaD [Flavobacterium sp.]